MQKVTFDRFGDVDVLSVQTVAEPVIATPNDVLINVHQQLETGHVVGKLCLKR